MTKLQFRVLYRQFLFRMVDLELISAQGDISKLLGQFAGLLVFFSSLLALGAMLFDRRMSPLALQAPCVLGIQGLGARLLLRRHFLRLSAFLQIAAFCWFLCVYFLEPSLVTPQAFTAPQNQRALWLPSFWFLGFFHQLNGSMHPVFAPLARRAWLGLAISIGGTAVAYALSYFRTLKKIVEEPDIVPGMGGANWLPRFANSLETAVVQFSIRTLARSRQHRMMLAFFLGIGSALLVFVIKNPGPKDARLRSELPVLFASVAAMCITVVGTRVVFSMPISLRANWIFRVTQVRGSKEDMAAIRRPLFALAVAPVLVLAAGLLFSIWPWRLAAEHLVVLGFIGATVAYACLAAFQKIPFTCSYLPGKSYLHMAFLTAMGLMLFIIRGVVLESEALGNRKGYTIMFVVLAAVTLAARWWAVWRANEEDAVVQFEELPTPALQLLGLNRDGVVMTEGATRHRAD